MKLLATLEIQRHRYIMGKVPSNSIWSVQLLLPTVFAALEHQVASRTLVCSQSLKAHHRCQQRPNLQLSPRLPHHQQEMQFAAVMLAPNGTVALPDMHWERTFAVRILAVPTLGSLAEATEASAGPQLVSQSTHSRKTIGRSWLARMPWGNRRIERLPMPSSATARHTESAGLQKR